MTAMKTMLAGGAALAAAVAFATPASAQYFPGPGYGYGGGDVLSQVIGGMIGGGRYGSPYGYGYGSQYGSPYGYGMPYGGNYGYGSPNGYGYSSPYGRSGNQIGQYAVGQCMGAVQQKLNGGYGQGGARVLGVSDVQSRSNGGMLVSGVANSGATSNYGYGGQLPVDLTFTCKTDASGMVASIDIGQTTRAMTNVYRGPVTPSPYANDYSAYGYTRY